MSSFRFTKLKITVGYVLLLGILSFSLLFVYREMGKLSAADDRQNLRTDSILSLLHEKDKNTLQMLRVLSEANDSLLSASIVEEVVSEQDSLITVQKVQHKVVTKRDTVMAAPEKKGFFKRLAEAFVPSKRDSAVLVNSLMEVATDTILEPAPTVPDSIQEKLRMAKEEQLLQRKKRMKRTSTRYQRVNSQLTARVDSLIKGYENSMVRRAKEDAELQQEAKMRSARTIAGIAIGAVLLSAFFLVVIGRDITRSNRYRKQLEEANRRAEDLLEAREKLMLTITHDFKAPLSSIMGYTELLSRLTRDERQRFYLDNMKVSSEHLLKLVSDLLDFHRLDLNKAEVNRVAFNPAQLFEETRVSFEPLTAAKGLWLKCEVVPSLSGRYVGDPLRLRQIVNNLLSNAVKFTKEGGVTLSANYAYGRLVVVVADTGEGMAPEDKERIFQEFTRLPGAQGEEGFGLGLSIVKKLVDLLRGNIRVWSEPHRGSSFTVTLPLPKAAEDAVPERKEETPPAMPLGADGELSRKALRVLLIDDDRIQLRLTEAMLAQSGIETVCCERVEELTERLRESGFDVLLTDIQMPAINGFDLVKLLRASNIPQARTIPVIAVTARSEMDESDLYAHGFAGCLHKPFTVKELLAAIGYEEVDASGEREADTAPGGLNFGALTAFSGDDGEAATAILSSFVEETGKSLERMRGALRMKDAEELSAVAHKLLPLFTLIGALEVTPSLRRLEAGREEGFSPEIEKTATSVLEAIADVVRQAREYAGR